MTISPSADGYTMTCDECGHSRPVLTPADVARAWPLGWQRVTSDEYGPTRITRHRCPKCAAHRRMAA